MAVRNWLVFRWASAPKAPESKVRDVQEQVRNWAALERGQKKMCTARPGWQMTSIRNPTYKAGMRQISVELVDVLSIDEERGIVRVEPLVTMGQLTATLLPLGWTVPVVPELDDLTVGGLVNGAGVETSGHHYGLFQHICVSHEIVTADGYLLRCSQEENAELFYCIPWSHGTLGFLVATELRIIPAKPFVRLQYVPCHDTDTMIREFEKALSEPENEFVEGIVYSKETGVIMKGSFDDEPHDHRKINAIGRFYKPWFYKHVEKYLATPALPDTDNAEWIPLRDYYHRHTRSLFWELGDIIPFGNAPWFRYLAGWMVPPKVAFLKLTQPPQIKKMYDRHHLLQDIFVPLKTFKASLHAFHKHAALYPLWICPFRLPPLPGLVHPAGAEEMYIDIGAYVAGFEPGKAVPAIEDYTRSVHGFQMTYADTYMSREEFQTMFDHSLYNKVRKELGAEEAFPAIYDKLHRNART